MGVACEKFTFFAQGGSCLPRGRLRGRSVLAAHGRRARRNGLVVPRPPSRRGAAPTEIRTLRQCVVGGEDEGGCEKFTLFAQGGPCLPRGRLRGRSVLAAHGCRARRNGLVVPRPPSRRGAAPTEIRTLRQCVVGGEDEGGVKNSRFSPKADPVCPVADSGVGPSLQHTAAARGAMGLSCHGRHRGEAPLPQEQHSAWQMPWERRPRRDAAVNPFGCLPAPLSAGSADSGAGYGPYTFW